MGRAIEEKITEAFEKVRTMLPVRIPISTYRLQFNRGFSFKDAREIVRYLHELGITDVYSSPYYRAESGSTHGYDVVDHHVLNPEVGTEDEYMAFVSELASYGMGQIMDIVPNHMSIASRENMWWQDVLENGQSSPYCAHFDIDWEPIKDELEGKVIIPILGDHYGRVLENGEIRLAWRSGSFHVEYYSHRLPVDPVTYEHILSYRLDEFERTIGGESADFQELLSIITATRNLPPRTEHRPDRMAERLREKEVIKRRIRELHESCPPFRAFVEENVRLYNGTKGSSPSFDLLDGLLSAQVYRLAFWRVATEEINYRRFFDINDLAAIKTEDPEVFIETHSLVLRLVRDGCVKGLRVDHPDGLHDPSRYFERLQEECFVQACLGEIGRVEGDPEQAEASIRQMYRSRLDDDPALRTPFYIVGEKILMSGERLPEDWSIYGTTGYSFMNSVAGVLVDPAGEKPIEKAYERFTRLVLDYQDLVYEKKRLIMESSLAGEINVLGHRLNRISERHRMFRDFTLNSLTDAVVEVIACFPVYRTYITQVGVTETDLRYIDKAVARAKRRRRDLDESIFDFLRDVLALQCPDSFGEEEKGHWLDYSMRFQQLTGPVMAKGLEDTVFYIYNRLSSLNEVGGDPSRFGLQPEAFHGQNIETRKRWPYTLRATSTHDSKRGEDTRARINVISEFPEEWRECLRTWSRINRRLKKVDEGAFVPDRNEEYLIYQTLLGAWPLRPPDGGELDEFVDRMVSYTEKALREAKINSNWLNPDKGYEDAVKGFVEGVIRSPQFREAFSPFQQKVSRLGALNSLSQTLLKITTPGVPDFYQGTELWHLRLVDPDNRMPVDYGLMTAKLKELKELEGSNGEAALASELLGNMSDGRIKMYLTYKALSFRRANRELYMEGDYLPLETSGPRRENIISFARTQGKRVAITVAPRLVGKLTGGSMPVGDVWKDTHITLPDNIGIRQFRNVFTGSIVETRTHEGQSHLWLEDVFANFPAALLEEAH